MNLVKIGVKLNNENLASLLARRLAELETGLCITVLRQRDEAENYKEGEFDFIITEDVFKEHYPADELLEYIADQCIRNGLEFFKKSAEKLSTIHISSDYGGSGCTALALALGRIAASEKGTKTVLIFSGCSKSYESYWPEISIKRPTGELEYVISHNIKRNLQIYMCRDSYGLFAIRCREGADKLAERLLREHGFETVFIESGNSGLTYNCDAGIKVFSQRDIRCAADADKETDENNTGIQLNVINFSGYRDVSGNIIRIPEDTESFMFKENRVGISMKGAFSEAVHTVFGVLQEKTDE